MRFALAVLAVSLQLVLSEGAPATHKDRRSWYGGQIPVVPESTQNCSIFLHPYCNGIGYHTALFPNRRGQGYDDASREFSDFTALLQTAPQCSAKLGTLLCFFYFPFCNMTHGQSTSLETHNEYKAVMPCRETCQEVRSDCEGVLLRYGYTWPSHFDCSAKYFLPASPTEMKCANGTVQHTLTKTEPKTPTPIEGESGGGCQGENNNDVNGDCRNTTNKPTEESTTKEPTEEPTLACSCRCDVRDTCTGKTFIRNSYTFAAKVTVHSSQIIDGTQTYSVNVLKQYSLKSEVNGKMELAPDMAEFIVLHANSKCCDTPCPAVLETGMTYMVCGHYQRSPMIQWNMWSDDSLASLWKKKYDKSMEKWIEKGNTHRLGELENGVEER